LTNEEIKAKYDLKDPYQIAKYIKEVQKRTPVKAYLRGYLRERDLDGFNYFGIPSACVVLGESDAVAELIEATASKLTFCQVENAARNSAVPLLDMTTVDARIEPGAYIREGAQIHRNAVVMMGAVINIGAVVGEGSMIDMNAVLGARATVGRNCHIGAGAVLAGVLEPPSSDPVVIEDGVVIGANAVVLEGVRVGENAVVAAGAVVTENVPAAAVVAGSPAKVVKEKDEKTESKTELLGDLRG
jgi:2,3,4,5-tetrahydropyridine-2-carboxylate N-succinyltransferase